MIRDEEVYQIGVITRTHGIRGEVAMSFTDDVWDRADADYVFLLIDGCFIPFFFEEWRFRSDTVCLFKFRDIDSVERAEELCGCEVWFPKELTPEETGGQAFSEVSPQRFTGYTLEADGKKVGRIARVDTTTVNTLFELADGRLIPAAEPFIREIDAAARCIVMTLPEGLLDQ